MAYNALLLRYGELFLKGKNKPLFEKKLIGNLLKLTGAAKVKKLQSRLVANYFPEHTKLKNVFGLASYSPAVRADKSEKEIQEAALELLKEKKGTFRVQTNRADKSFPITSPEFNRIIGKFIEEKSSLEFSFENPDTILGIEINQDGAYLFLETISCFGGLPTGVEGKALLLVENEASLLAGLLFMKRGCTIFPAAFKEKELSLLQKFSPNPLSLRIMSSFKEIETFCFENNIKVIISSQNFKNYQKHDSSLLIMRPLIAYDSRKIKEELQKFRD